MPGCARCGSATLRPTQHFCHACGESLSQAHIQTSANTSANGVGDGGQSILRYTFAHWVRTNQGRRLRRTGGVTLVIIVAIVIIAALASSLPTLASLVPYIPIVVAILAFVFMATTGGRLRRRGSRYGLDRGARF